MLKGGGADQASNMVQLRDILSRVYSYAGVSRVFFHALAMKQPARKVSPRDFRDSEGVLKHVYRLSGTSL